MKEGPFVGSRCLAHVEHGWMFGAMRRLWSFATIHKVYADGTFRIGLDENALPGFPRNVWYGVTRSELRFDDVAMWPACREALLLPQRLGLPELQRVVAFHTPDAAADAVAAWWSKTVEARFGVSARTASSYTIDPDSAYRMIVRAGYSATETVERSRGIKSSRADTIVYWNQLRQGGRPVDEVKRQITVNDAIAALGLPPEPAPLEQDWPEPVRRLTEASTRELPASLRTYVACIEGDPCVPARYRDLHPLGESGLASILPNPIDVVWPIVVRYRGLRALGLEGDLGAPILEQHGMEWVAVFDPAESDARIYVALADEGGDSAAHVDDDSAAHVDDDSAADNDNDGGVDDTDDERNRRKLWRRTAPSSVFFLWDLAQTALAWWEDNAHPGALSGRTILHTDVGFALSR